MTTTLKFDPAAAQLTAVEDTVFTAVRKLNHEGRTTNTAQLQRETRLPRNQVDSALQQLRARHLVQDVSSNAAHHWRLTSKGLDLVRARSVTRSQAAEAAEPEKLSPFAVGETNRHTGHLVVDQRGAGDGAVVLAWRYDAHLRAAQYATWRLFTTWSGERGYDAGHYFQGANALQRATEDFLTR